jgi:hypothetical protein
VGYSKRQFVDRRIRRDRPGVVCVRPPAAGSGDRSLRRLDAMMAEWNAKGIRLGYPLPGSPENSDINAESERA